MTCKIPPSVLAYIEEVEKGVACKEQKALVQYVRKCFAKDDIYVDLEQLNHYLSLSKYFSFDRLFPWQEFLLTLWDCTYWRKTNRPRWKTVFCMIGRGAGKDGFIAYDGMCSISPYNPVPHYNVDICANNEEQAIRPQLDLVEVLETPKYEAKLKKHFYHTKEIIQGKKNKGVMKGHTNNPKGRDGLRSGKVIFNEVHIYQNYDNIKVFVTGMGKVAQPRVGYFTSNGDVSDGVLDDYLARGRRILFEGEEDNGFLPFICCLDDKNLVDNPQNWVMANPSLPYLPELQSEIEEEYREWKEHPEQNGDFMTKRMGIRSGVKEIMVTDYENVLATNKPLPDMKGWYCTVGIDYAELSDWAAVNFHFRKGNMRYDINHAWVCSQSRDLYRLKVPYQEWARKGDITIIDEPTIQPDYICGYIAELGKKYSIRMIALDNFRYSLMENSLKKIGFDGKDKNKVKLIRPSDIMQTATVIDYCFNNQLFAWGDVPHLRWAVNNTKRVRSSRNLGVDTGNFVYAKIEAKSRKTDPFMALVASMTCESVLGSGVAKIPPIGAIAF